MASHGKGLSFYTADKSRAFYKMPFCHERHKHSDDIDYQQIEEFFMKLKELDQHFGSEEFKNKLSWREKRC